MLAMVLLSSYGCQMFSFKHNLHSCSAAVLNWHGMKVGLGGVQADGAGEVAADGAAGAGAGHEAGAAAGGGAVEARAYGRQR